MVRQGIQRALTRPACRRQRPVLGSLIKVQQLRLYLGRAQS